MPSRGLVLRLALLVIVALAAVAADFGIFLYRQRHGEVISFVNVRKYVASPLKNGKYEFDYIGDMDVPCVEAMLPHHRMPPCWWVGLHTDHWD